MVRILLADDHDVVRRGLREQLSQQAGADYFLQKPFDIAEMEALILEVTQ